MNWIQLNSEAQLEDINTESKSAPVFIMKHSTRCSISSMALNRLEKTELDKEATFYYLDLLKHRNISDKIAHDYQVHHESPQVMLIINGECVYEETHNGINAAEIKEQIAEWKRKLS